ncbi:class I SAM-dependent methyltransferase [Candidatus Falkowbacteria bacterium]|nr:class I SAM-dependent methyltransferase [Candidatus Falkowbacteria bacterium]
MDYKDYIAQQKKETDHFWYVSRLGLIDRLLKSVQFSDKLILDIGCGTGTELETLSRYGQVVGSDNNPEALQLAAARGYNTLLCDLDRDNLPKASYDVICAFDVLEHLPDDEKVLSNIYGALRPGGYFIFTVPAFQFIFSPHDKAMGHFRRYGRAELLRKLGKANFSKVETYYWNFLLFLPIVFMRLVKKIIFGSNANELARTEAQNLPRPINTLLKNILNAEVALFKNKLLPFGLTIYCIAQKNES